MGILCGFVAVAMEWLITHHCLMSILDGLDFMFGKMFQQGVCLQVYICFDIEATVFLVEVLSGVF